MKRLFLLLLCLLSICACQLSPIEGDNSNDIFPENSSIEENTDLFEYNTSERSYTFFTNNRDYITETGYTFWHTDGVNNQESFNSLKYTVIKESGNNEAGYGLIFCKQKIENKDFMLSVMINVKGQYIIGKIVDGVFSPVTEWKSSGLLRKGLGSCNEINISYFGEDKQFSLVFNGIEEIRFAIEENISFKDSKYGFVTVISNYERFPVIPVKVVFKNR